MTMQRSLGSSELPSGGSGGGLGALSSSSAGGSLSSSNTALGLLTGFDTGGPQPTSLSRGGNGHRFSASSSNPLWGQASTPSSIPLLSPSELAGAADSQSNSDAYALLAQMRQRIEAEEAVAGVKLSQMKKRPRLMIDDDNGDHRHLKKDSSSTTTTPALGTANPFLGGMGSPASSSFGGLSSSDLHNPYGVPSLLRGSSLSSTAPSGLFSSSSLTGLPSSSSGTGSVASRIEQLLREQQLQGLQHVQERKRIERIEEMERLAAATSASSFSSASRENALLQLMLQQQQQQHLHQQQLLGTSSSAASERSNHMSLAAQLKALSDHQETLGRNKSLEESAVAAFMMKNSERNFGGSNNNSHTLSGLERISSAHIQQMARAQQLLQQHHDNDGMPPPPPMVSAVSSLDSVAIMQMLLPNQQGGGAAGGPVGNLNPYSNHGMHQSFAAAHQQSMMGMPRQGGTNVSFHPSAADAIYEQRRLAAAAEVSNTVRDSSVGKPPDAFADRDSEGRAKDLPTLLVVPMDHMQLSSHQTLLRYQIEVFRAGEEDTSTHTRGRNKPVQLGQIGIRCRHCKVLPVSRRKRGSVYFPRAVEGFYQAAQNMNSTHLQTGECPLMGDALRREFANLIATRGVSTGAGRAYWAKQARKLGLRNTEEGIVFDKLASEEEEQEAKEASEDAKVKLEDVAHEIDELNKNHGSMSNNKNNDHIEVKDDDNDDEMPTPAHAPSSGDAV